MKLLYFRPNFTAEIRELPQDERGITHMRVTLWTDFVVYMQWHIDRVLEQWAYED